MNLVRVSETLVVNGDHLFAAKVMGSKVTLMAFDGTAVDEPIAKPADGAAILAALLAHQPAAMGSDASPHTVLDDLESIYFDVAKHVPPDAVGKLAAVLPLVARLRGLVP